MIKMICAALVWSLLFLFSCPVHGQEDFHVIKDRVVGALKKSGVNDIRVKQLLNSQREDGTWPGINYVDVSRTGFEHRFHLQNMIVLGKSWTNPSSAYYHSNAVIACLNQAVKNWVDEDYFCDNWWHNQIGTPNALVTILLLVGDQLDVDLVQGLDSIMNRANINAGGARPGGDRIKIAGIQARYCLFKGDVETTRELMQVIQGEIKQVEWIGQTYGYGFRDINGGFKNRTAVGRGIQYDNSFHHRIDGVNNTLSYGRGYASALVEWAWYTRGTGFAFEAEKLRALINYYLDGICKTAVYGKYPDMGAKNRSISRKGSLHAYNSQTPLQLLACSDYRSEELKEIVAIRTDGTFPTRSHATFFWNSEHFSLQRPDFFTSVRMYSTRNFNMEEPYNSEGLLNHHRGDGANHISLRGDEYADIAPVFDYQKIPGATILQKETMPSPKEIQKLGLTDFAGAATDGYYACVGFDFKSPHDPIVARKGWFFFDDFWLCLGAGISTRVNRPVYTTINQCLLHGEVLVGSMDGIKKYPFGESEEDSVRWVYHDGVAYYFPGTSSATLKKDTVVGSWYSINQQSDSPKDTIRKAVFSLWLDHGKQSLDATYAYVVQPAISPEDISYEALMGKVSVVANTPELQAVYNQEKEILQAVFYKAGSLGLSSGLELVSYTPGIVMLKMEKGRIAEITVADPNRELLKMQLEINQKQEGQGRNGAVFLMDPDASNISIDLPQGKDAGSSVILNF